MEQRERTILEIVIAVVFVVILILGSIVVINVSEGSESETTITNSFNTYNYDTYPATTRTQYTTSTRPYIVDRNYYDYERVYPSSRVVYTDYPVYSDNRRHFMYDSWSQLRIGEGLFGNSINNYEVYVQNREYTGGYFKVVFYFEDYDGNVKTNAIRHYIDPREESRFVFKDVAPSPYEYRNWWYEVYPETKSYFYGN